MAFVIARYWGVLPHVVWRLPFRYYKELRDGVIEAAKPDDESDIDPTFDWEDESKTGPMV